MFFEHNLQDELLVAEVMAAELNDYFYRGELFHQVVVHTPHGELMPKMTLGGLWERLLDLRDHWTQLSPGEKRRWQVVEHAFSEAWAYHKEQAEVLLRREFESYLHSWRWYMEDLIDAPYRAGKNYAAEVHNRQRLTLLGKLATDHGIDLSAGQKAVDALDNQLRQLWRPGKYIGRADEAQYHNPVEEWYLFGRPAEDRSSEK